MKHVDRPAGDAVIRDKKTTLAKKIQHKSKTDPDVRKEQRYPARTQVAKSIIHRHRNKTVDAQQLARRHPLIRCHRPCRSALQHPEETFILSICRFNLEKYSRFDCPHCQSRSNAAVVATWWFRRAGHIPDTGPNRSHQNRHSCCIAAA